MLKGCLYIPAFIADGNLLFDYLKDQIVWREDIKARKTASFGIPYDYSNTFYLETTIPSIFVDLFTDFKKNVGFTPNNVLLNYYYNGNSKMGFHSDNIEILESNTGIVIISLGSERILRFKKKISKEYFDIVLENGSLFYMNQAIQKKYLHSILIANEESNERISITFRKIKTGLK